MPNNSYGGGMLSIDHIHNLQSAQINCIHIQFLFTSFFFSMSKAFLFLIFRLFKSESC